jgi:arsenite-transporting ATPase
VLLAVQDVTPAPGLLLGQALGPDPQPIEPNLWALQFQSTVLLERSWETIKGLESQYLRTPFIKDIYGQEARGVAGHGCRPGPETPCGNTRAAVPMR